MIIACTVRACPLFYEKDLTGVGEASPPPELPTPLVQGAWCLALRFLFTLLLASLLTSLLAYSRSNRRGGWCCGGGDRGGVPVSYECDAFDGFAGGCQLNGSSWRWICCITEECDFRLSSACLDASLCFLTLERHHESCACWFCSYSCCICCAIPSVIGCHWIGG